MNITVVPPQKEAAMSCGSDPTTPKSPWAGIMLGGTSSGRSRSSELLHHEASGEIQLVDEHRRDVFELQPAPPRRSSWVEWLCLGSARPRRRLAPAPVRAPGVSFRAGEQVVYRLYDEGRIASGALLGHDDKPRAAMLCHLIDSAVQHNATVWTVAPDSFLLPNESSSARQMDLSAPGAPVQLLGELEHLVAARLRLPGHPDYGPSAGVGLLVVESESRDLLGRVHPTRQAEAPVLDVERVQRLLTRGPRAGVGFLLVDYAADLGAFGGSDGLRSLVTDCGHCIVLPDTPSFAADRRRRLNRDLGVAWLTGRATSEPVPFTVTSAALSAPLPGESR
jgi:hypothetical protein